MKYLLLYKGYPKKSLRDVSMQTINKMGGRKTVEEKYVILPMKGTLEEVLAEYVNENRLSLRDTKVLAKGMDVDFDSIQRTNYVKIPARLATAKNVQISGLIPIVIVNKIKAIANEQKRPFTTILSDFLKRGLEYYKQDNSVIRR